MIKDIIEDIDYGYHNIWYHGHIYITDENEIIWGPTSAPLHNRKPKNDFNLRSAIVGSFLTSDLSRKYFQRQRINLNDLLMIRRVENNRMKKKGYAQLLVQTLDEDISFRGKITRIEKLEHFIPNPNPTDEKPKSSPIYFYKDIEIISQLFEQTPEGDIVEIIREAGIKIGAKGRTEFGNELITRLTLELSTELMEKAIIKSQVTDSKKIAVITLNLIANGEAQDIMKFDLRKLPNFLYFDYRFMFEWANKDYTNNNFELSGKIGPVLAKLTLVKSLVVHEALFNNLRTLEHIKLQGLAKSSYADDGSIILIPIVLTS